MRFIGMLLAVMALSALAFAVDIYDCGVLSQPNTVYNLKNSISGNGEGPCISITADDVTFDGEGNTISVPFGIYSAGVLSTAARTRITNVHVEGSGEVGIQFIGTTDGEIENSDIKVINSDTYYSVGIRLKENSERNVIRNTRAVGYYAGIELNSGSDYNTVENTDSEGQIFGLTIDLDSQSNVVKDSSMVGEGAGLYLTNAFNNQIYYSQIKGGTGAHIERSDGNRLIGNTIEVTPTGNELNGVYIGNADRNEVRSNSIRNMLASGTVVRLEKNPIYPFANTTEQNLITDNVLAGSASVTAVDIGTGTSYNSIYWNRIASGVWVSNQDPTNSFEAPIDGPFGQGNAYYFADGTPSWNVYDIVDLSGDHYADAGSDTPFSSATVSPYWFGFGEDWHPYTLNTQTADDGAGKPGDDFGVAAAAGFRNRK